MPNPDPPDRGASPVQRATVYAAQAHCGQTRKGTLIPYVIHPLNVGAILLLTGADEEVGAAGILHDTLEDTPVTSEDLRAEFGRRITELVEGVSERDKSLPWEARKRHTLGELETAPLDVVMIACADKLDNMRTLKVQLALEGESFRRHFHSSPERQRWYYGRLAALFLRRLAQTPMADAAEECRLLVKENFGG